MDSDPAILATATECRLPGAERLSKCAGWVIERLAEGDRPSLEIGALRQSLDKGWPGRVWQRLRAYCSACCTVTSIASDPG
jgi:hypothetical protein